METPSISRLLPSDFGGQPLKITNPYGPNTTVLLPSDYTPVYDGGLFDEDFLEVNLAFHPLVQA